MNTVYLLLGGNLGNKKENLQTAISHIEASVGQVLKKSALYETAPWGFEHETSFLNQAILIETKKNPQELLSELLDIETSMGRVRDSKVYSGRTIDIDIVFFNNEIVDEQNLKIPHPRIHERKFALIPLNEIAEDYLHPAHQKKVSNLLAECMDELKVKQL